MPLSNWTVYQTGTPAVGILTQISDPIAFTPTFGSGSLRVEQYGLGDGFVNMYNTTYPLELGLLKGRYRSILRPRAFTGSTHYSAGFVCMQSQTNLTGGVGSCYFAHLTVQATGASAQFVIRKFSTTGLQRNLLASTTLYTGLDLGSVLGQNICLEVEWDASGGVECILTLRQALNSADFDDLVEETTVTDSVSPLLVSTAEGIAFTNGTISGTTSWILDSTSLVKLL